ncbi:NAD(P)/FAD-dependent oxidoreductase [Patescibacteria group bacterium]|nr:MAG: NAD(P)/FAD-dependent oxidoreductase [Patescibacteria group bacterium]
MLCYTVCVMAVTKKPIIIVGGGFAGLRLARILSRYRRRIPDNPALLLDRHTHHVYTPLLYEVASGCTTPSELAPALIRGATFRFTEVIKTCCEVNFLHEEVVALDAAAKTVTTKSGVVLAYEKLALAVGAETDFFNIPGLREKALTLKTRRDALVLRERIAACLKKKREGKEVLLNIFVGGGGATGVEFAAEIAGCFRQMERRGALDRSDWSITLVEATPRLLGSLKTEYSARVKERLVKLGVKVHLDTCIKRVEGNHVVLAPRPLRAGETIEELVCEFRAEFEKKFETDIIVWTGGVRGAAILEKFGLPLDRKGRVIVGGDQRLAGNPDIFVIGDSAAVTNPVTKETAPMLAQSATRQAEVAATQILADLGVPVSRRSYDFPVYPAVIPLGGKQALAVIGQLSFPGFFGWLVRQAADFRYFLSILPWRRAITAFFHGAWLYTRND